MSENTGAPQPEWDAERAEWVSGAYRWDAAAGQWLPRATASVSEPAAQVDSAPAADAPTSAVEPPQASADSSSDGSGPQQPYAAQAPQQPYGTPEPQQPHGAPQLPYASPQPPYASPAPQAYASATAPQPYAPQQPYGSPGAPAPRKKLPTGALIGIIAGGVVVLLAVVLGIVFAVRAVAPGPTTASPEQVVTDYLSAIAAGDSKKALSYLEMKPDDTTLLTDEALAASAAAGPIADVVVTAPKVSRDDYSVPVTVDYTIGGEPVSGQFQVVDFSGKGTWTIGRGTIDIYVGDDFTGLNPTVNGVAVDADTVTVFPGSVELAIDNPNYALTGTTTTIVSDPEDYAAEFDADVELSEAGLATFRTAVTDAVTACIASKNLVAGCGIDLPDVLSDGTKIIDGTITRTLDADTQATLANLEPEEIFGDPTQVRATYLGGLDVTADCEVNGQRQTGCTFLFLPTLGSPLVDMTTEPPVVRWD